MDAADKALQALEAARKEELQARLELLKRQRAYLAIKDVRREALRVRRR